MSSSNSTQDMALARTNREGSVVHFQPLSGALAGVTDLEGAAEAILSLETVEEQEATCDLVLKQVEEVSNAVKIDVYSFFERLATKIPAKRLDAWSSKREDVKKMRTGGRDLVQETNKMRQQLRTEFGHEQNFPFLQQILHDREMLRNLRTWLAEYKKVFEQSEPADQAFSTKEKQDRFCRWVANQLSRSQHFQLQRSKSTPGAQGIGFVNMNLEKKRHWHKFEKQLAQIDVFSDEMRKARLQEHYKLDKYGFTIKRADEEIGDENLEEPTSLYPVVEAQPTMTHGPSQPIGLEGSKKRPPPQALERVSSKPGSSQQAAQEDENDKLYLTPPPRDIPGSASPGTVQKLKDRLEKTRLESAVKPAAKPAPKQPTRKSGRLAGVGAGEIVVNSIETSPAPASSGADDATQGRSSPEKEPRLDPQRTAPVIEEEREIEPEDEDEDVDVEDESELRCKACTKSGATSEVYHCVIISGVLEGVDDVWEKKKVATSYASVDFPPHLSQPLCGECTIKMGNAIGLSVPKTIHPEHTLHQRIVQMGSMADIQALVAWNAMHRGWFTEEANACFPKPVPRTRRGEKDADAGESEDDVHALMRELDRDYLGPFRFAAAVEVDLRATDRIREKAWDLLDSNDNKSSWADHGYLFCSPSAGGAFQIPDTLLKAMRKEFALYRWHNIAVGQYGWSRGMWYSLSQQLLRQCPLLWLYWLVTTPCTSVECVAYPSAAFHIFDDEAGWNAPDGFQHVALNEHIVHKGRGLDQVQFAISLDEAGRGGRLLLTSEKAGDGFFDHEEAKLLAKRVIANKQTYSTGFFETADPVITDEMKRRLQLQWSNPCSDAGSLVVSHPYIPQRYIGTDEQYRMIPIVFLACPGSRTLDDLPDGERVEVTTIHGAHLYRERMPFNAAGAIYPVRASKPFAAEKLLTGLGPISDALVGRVQWTDWEVSMELQKIFRMDKDGFKVYMAEWWATAEAQFTAASATIEGIEKHVFGKKSFVGAEGNLGVLASLQIHANPEEVPEGMEEERRPANDSRI